MSGIPFLTISEKIRKQPKLPESLQQNCKILSLPADVVHMVIKSASLSLFDRACLALTCKAFADLVISDEKNLVNENMIEVGNEEELIDELRYREWSDDDESEEASHLALEELQAKLAGRVSQVTLAGFFERLNSGWNRSGTRHCFQCGVFRSTDLSYWVDVNNQFKYKQNGQIARTWRALTTYECYHCDPMEQVEKWVNKDETVEQQNTKPRGVEKLRPKYSHCPLCFVSDHNINQCCCSDYPPCCSSGHYLHCCHFQH